MKRCLTIIFVLFSFLQQAFPLDLQELERASEISTGTLPNGIRYYVVANRQARGVADFALVQEGWSDRNTARVFARHALVELPHFGQRRPCDFLADNGVGYGRRGFVTYRDDAAVFSFKDVPVTSQTVTDSTMLMLFDIAAGSPYEQAVIVSGDIDPSKIKERMTLFSMTVSKRKPLPPGVPYSWQPRPVPYSYFAANPSPRLAAVRVTYAAPRVPVEQMNTLQQNVTLQYAAYLGTVLGNRVRADFRNSGIPLAGLRYRHSDSAAGPGDEQYTFTVITSSEFYDDAVRHLASILADLDTRGATLVEMRDAKDQLVSEAIRNGGNVPVTNTEYVRRCIAAYRYNASLASDASVNRFFVSSRLSDDRELELFNNFVFALLDPESNLTIGFDTPGAVPHPELSELFDSAWRSAAADSIGRSLTVGYGDTLKLCQPTSRQKVKIRTETSESVSGGSVWTFSNGIRVIYRKTDVKGQFYYAMMLRGGAGLVRDLAPGENAFVGDMLPIGRISGMPGQDFASMLRANGIEMKTGVSLSDLRIEGSAPQSKLGLLLKSLLSIATSREPDREGFEYYRKCEDLRVELERYSDLGVRHHLDSLLFPGGEYTAYKRMDALGDDLPERAEEYFASRFSNVNDGVVVLVGDLDGESLRKVLQQYLSGFGTGRMYSVRPAASRQAVVGTATYTVDASEARTGDGFSGVHVAVTTPMPFNMTNCMSMYAAAEVLRRELAGNLSRKGAWAEVTPEVSVFPDERMTLYVDCRFCDEDGLPEGVEPGDAVGVLSAVRAALATLSRTEVGPSMLESCKSALLNSMETEYSLDRATVYAVLAKYSEGKDIVSGYREHVESVSAESVKSLFGAFNGGGRIEYVIK